VLSEERQDLEDFIGRCARLRGTRLIKDVQRARLTITWTPQKDMHFQSSGPDEEVLSAGLLVLRPMISRGDRLLVGHIHNIAHRYLDHTGARTALSKAYAMFKGAQAGSGMKFYTNEGELTTEHLADLLINGYYFHEDPAKAAELKRLAQGAGSGALVARHQFLVFINETCRALLYIGSIIDQALRQHLFR
jgi:hypothetical protein